MNWGSLPPSDKETREQVQVLFRCRFSPHRNPFDSWAADRKSQEILIRKIPGIRPRCQPINSFTQATAIDLIERHNGSDKATLLDSSSSHNQNKSASLIISSSSRQASPFDCLCICIPDIIHQNPICTS